MKVVIMEYLRALVTVLGDVFLGISDFNINAAFEFDGWAAVDNNHSGSWLGDYSPVDGNYLGVQVVGI